jgi:hypothetical protein
MFKKKNCVHNQLNTQRAAIPTLYILLYKHYFIDRVIKNENKNITSYDVVLYIYTALTIELNKKPSWAGLRGTIKVLLPLTP